AMVPISRTSSILDGDRLQHLGGRLAAVHGRLQQVVDVLPLDQVGRRAVVGEEGRQCLARHQVGLVLEPVDLDSSRLQIPEAFQEALGELEQGVLNEPSLLGEEVVEAALLGDEAEFHAAPTSELKGTGAMVKNGLTLSCRS